MSRNRTQVSLVLACALFCTDMDNKVDTGGTQPKVKSPMGGGPDV